MAIRRVAVTACALLVCGCQQLAGPTPMTVDSADPGNWTRAWQPFLLPGKRPTAYSAQADSRGWVLHAASDASASIYRRPLRIESADLGDVSFSWKVTALPTGGDVREVDSGDAVRVMLAFDGDHSRLGVRDRMMFDLMQALTGEPPPFATLMYVWNARACADTVVIHKRSDRVRKIVLESGPEHLGQWRQYRRNVRADYRLAFGEEPGPLVGVAVMTDSDNTQSRAEAWYGEIRFQ